MPEESKFAPLLVNVDRYMNLCLETCELLDDLEEDHLIFISSQTGNDPLPVALNALDGLREYLCHSLDNLFRAEKVESLKRSVGTIKADQERREELSA